MYLEIEEMWDTIEVLFLISQTKTGSKSHGIEYEMQVILGQYLHILSSYHAGCPSPLKLHYRKNGIFFSGIYDHILWHAVYLNGVHS